MRLNWTVFAALGMESRAIQRHSRIHTSIIGPAAIRLTKEMIGESSGVILAGIAGALDPNLKIGDVLIETSGDYPWPKFPFQSRKIHCADHVISTVAEKAKLFSETRAVAVDMESERVRRFAEECGIPMLHIRAISDQANHAIPPEIFGWLDSMGNPRGAAVASGIARNPMLLPTLLRLRRHSAIACHAMAQAVSECLAMLSEDSSLPG
jgi:adenosylhomocysteine nucleosidase